MGLLCIRVLPAATCMCTKDSLTLTLTASHWSAGIFMRDASLANFLLFALHTSFLSVFSNFSQCNKLYSQVFRCSCSSQYTTARTHKHKNELYFNVISNDQSFMMLPMLDTSYATCTPSRSCFHHALFPSCMFQFFLPIRLYIVDVRGSELRVFPSLKPPGPCPNTCLALPTIRFSKHHSYISSTVM